MSSDLKKVISGGEKRNAPKRHFSLYLKKDSEFNLVFRKGKPYFGKYCLLKVLPRQSGRVGIVVSTKVSPLAVVRNLLKRRYKEMVRTKTKISQHDAWCVIVLNEASVGVPYSDLERDFLAICKKAQLL